jgi:exonuclease VII small subunit
VDTLTEKVQRATYLIKLCKTKLRATEEQVKDVLLELEQEDKDQDIEPF